MRKKWTEMTPEERRAERERSADLDRRLLEMIERYKQRIAARRAEASGQ